MSRREFTKTVYAQIVNRALHPQFGIVCEGCGNVLGRKPYHVDHTIADGLQIDKSKKLTADDGKLLGVECCHGPKTAQQDIPAIAKAKRREAKHLGITVPKQSIKSAPFPKTAKPERASKTPLPPRQLFRGIQS